MKKTNLVKRSVLRRKQLTAEILRPGKAGFTTVSAKHSSELHFQPQTQKDIDHFIKRFLILREIFFGSQQIQRDKILIRKKAGW